MKKNFRFWSLLLAILLMVSILGACTRPFGNEDREDRSNEIHVEDIGSVEKNEGHTPSLTEGELSRIYDPKNYEKDFVSGEVIVGLKSRNLNSTPKTLFSELDIEEIRDLYEPLVKKFEPTRELENKNIATNINEEKLERLMEKTGTVYLITLSSETKEGVLDAIELLKNNPIVAYAEPNYKSFPATTGPNDQHYLSGELWGMDKIQMPEAWAISTGSRSVKVGVMDNGFQIDHADLADNFDQSLAYYPAQNSYGINADIWEHNTYSGGHGTHVAGTIGAIGNNDIGVCGVNWEVTMVPIKITISNSNSESSAELITLALEYATLLELPVINYSYQIDYFNQPAINAVRDYEGLFVAAAGNGRSSIDGYSYAQDLGALSNVVFVANSKEDDKRSGLSSYGVNLVALAAPGTNILSTLTYDYDFYDGTSMATPHVAGAAALLLSINPDLTAEELKGAILDNVDVIEVPEDALPDHPYYPVYLKNTVSTGGRLNVYKAVMAVLSTTITVPDLEYNAISNMFEFSEVRLQSTSLFPTTNVYLEIRKSGNSLPIASENIDLGASGDELFTNTTSLGFAPNEHVEITIYITNSQNNQVSINRQLIHPMLLNND